MVKKKKKSPYLSNISEICVAEYNWSQDQTAAVLQSAQEQQHIYAMIRQQGYCIKRLSLKDIHLR